MSFVLIQSNLQGFPADIPGDEYFGLSAEDKDFYFPSTTQVNNFSVDLTIEYYEEVLNEEQEMEMQQVGVLDVTQVTFPNIGSYGFQVINNNPLQYTLRIFSTDVSGFFPGEVFQYFMKNRSVKTLPPPPEGNWLAIVRWQIPPIRRLILDYAFQVQLETGGDGFQMNQYAYWSFGQSFTRFQQSLAEGKL
jgi:hypothetical protein